MTEEFKIIQDKLKIANKKTLKQLLANKELCSEIIKRDVISEKELVQMYDVPLSYLKGLKRRRDISYFNSKGQLNVSEQGTKYFYFLDEVQNLMSYNITYNESFVFRYNLMNKVVLGFAKELLSEREANILTMLFKDNMSLDDISEKIYITRVRTTQLLNKATNRIIYRINQLEKMYNLSNDALSLRTENELLRKQNKELYRKFLRNQELNDLKSNTNVQHFLKYGYDIKDLKMSYLDFDLSVRTLNCLKLADILTLEDLLVYKKSDLMKFRNFGKTSLNELCDWLEDKYNWVLK
jgi:predicted DNA-binding protein YlxM (UPF0122 family)